MNNEYHFFPTLWVSLLKLDFGYMCTRYLICQGHEVTASNPKHHLIQSFYVLHFYLTTEDSGSSMVHNSSFSDLVSVKFVSEDGRLRDTECLLSSV